MSRSRLYLAMGLPGAVFIVFAALLIAGWGGPARVTLVSDLGSLLAGGFAVTSAALTARASQGRQRWAWVALTVGLVGWFSGDAIWAFYDLVLGSEPAPFPSAADAGYLLFSFAACAALVLLPIGGAGQSQTRLLFDGAIVAASLFVIFWPNGLDDVFHSGRGSPFAFAVSVTYPMADLVLLTVALLMLTRARSGQRAMVTVLAVAIGFMAVSDGAFVVLNADDDYVSGNLVDVGWVAGLLLLGCAALIGARSVHIEFGLAQAPARLALWLPYLPLPLATVCMVTSDASAPLLAAALLLVSAVLVRQIIVSDENRRLLVEVADQAFRDPLTGLANRALFRDRLTHATALQLRDSRAVAVLSIDLDDFKLVNDSLGHPAGDALLRASAERIADCVRTGDTVARIGGDEFAVLLEEGPDSPLIVAHRICDAFDLPFNIDGHDVFVRPSVGVAVGSAVGDAESSAETLLKQADLAMYAAKRSQHGGVHPFTSDMTLIDVSEVDPPRDRKITSGRHPSPGLQLFDQLRRAIDQGELSLVYQPKFTVTSGQVAGVEALVRWKHPQRGLLLPDQFLPLARQNGLMGALTEAVVHQAVRDAASWRAQGTDVPFAVNLFPPSLGDLELPGRIVRILTAGGLTTACLTVEITEDFLLGNVRRAREVLEMLRDAGIRVSIDDFGSGYSALSYLRDLPIDELKLDRQFIAPILEDERADVIVSAIIDLAHRLDMTCVAEGVEDSATAARLAEHGCDTIQGHYCSWPVAASNVLDVRPLATASAARKQLSKVASFEQC
ncbi:MAG: bifunctional diguanylate cyclase/phosphodiesterase [Mycobacterium sp.]